MIPFAAGEVESWLTCDGRKGGKGEERRGV